MRLIEEWVVKLMHMDKSTTRTSGTTTAHLPKNAAADKAQTAKDKSINKLLLSLFLELELL